MCVSFYVVLSSKIVGDSYKTERVIPKYALLWRHRPVISCIKPIDRCRSTKLPLDTNFQLSGTRSLSN